jgi:hypothetical protein
MSHEARVVSKESVNLISMVAGIAIMFGVLWACVHFNIVDAIPADWVWPFVAAAAVIELSRFSWGLWQRRASNPNNPNVR